MYKSLRSFLFRLEPERAHTFTLYALRGAQTFSPMLWLLQRIFSAPEKPVEAFGLRFKNPVGLAAGYDKDGCAVRGLAALGFGHVEVGTVTPRAQPGNPRPRVFRLPEDEAVINRMGFPGKGMDYVSLQLKSLRCRPTSMVIGVNLGKNKDTPLENAASDYIALMRIFSPLADYLTINISSPNTVGLRRLQGQEMLETLLGEIKNERSNLLPRRPVLVKLAPDLTDDELEDAVSIILQNGMDGIIATNTTLARAGLRSKYQGETGGLSGTPLRSQSEEMLGKIVRYVNGRVPIISAGGIMQPGDVKRRLELGATLVQIYTGLVYQGPGLVKATLRALAPVS